jgi:hypothetical protein
MTEDDDLAYNIMYVGVMLKGTSIEKELLKDQNKYYEFMYLLGKQRMQLEKEYNEMVVQPVLFAMMTGFVGKGLNLTKAESEVNTILQEEKYITSESSRLSNITNILKKSKPVYKQLSDGIGSKYPEAVDHYNIEIHVPFKNGYKSIFDAHIVMDAAGKVIELIAE